MPLTMRGRCTHTLPSEQETSVLARLITFSAKHRFLTDLSEDKRMNLLRRLDIGISTARTCSQYKGSACWNSRSLRKKQGTKPRTFPLISRVLSHLQSTDESVGVRRQQREGNRSWRSLSDRGRCWLPETKFHAAVGWHRKPIEADCRRKRVILGTEEIKARPLLFPRVLFLTIKHFLASK